MDDAPAEAVIWMPKWTWSSNDMADRYAKAAVDEHRAPYRVRMAIAAHDALTTQNAMWIGPATVVAIQQPGDPSRDTQASRAKAAEAAAAKRRKKAEAATEAAAATTETA